MAIKISASLLIALIVLLILVVIAYVAGPKLISAGRNLASNLLGMGMV